MKRNEFEERLRASHLDPAARWIAATYGSHAKWETGEGIRVSQLTVARETGYSRETVAKHTRNLEKQGWLIRTGTTKGNVATYRLGDGVARELGSVDEQEPELSQVVESPANQVCQQVANFVDSGCQDDIQVAKSIDEVAKPLGTNYTEPYLENFTMNNTKQATPAVVDKEEEPVPALATLGGAREPTFGNSSLSKEVNSGYPTAFAGRRPATHQPEVDLSVAPASLIAEALEYLEGRREAAVSWRRSDLDQWDDALTLVADPTFVPLARNLATDVLTHCSADMRVSAAFRKLAMRPP